MANQDMQENRSAEAAAEAAARAAEEAAPPADGTAGEQSVEQQLEALRAEKEEQFRGWQRTQADFVNYRRRVEQERADFIKAAEAGLISDLLPVLDDLERAIGSLPAEMRDLTWVQGILLIERKLAALLEQHGLQTIEALGKEFDPSEHEAVLRDGEPGEATTVTAELQRGYRLNDRVLRPTLVKVGPAENSNKR
jgi:molecular chaperone GrpE